LLDPRRHGRDLVQDRRANIVDDAAAIGRHLSADLRLDIDDYSITKRKLPGGAYHHFVFQILYAVPLFLRHLFDDESEEAKSILQVGGPALRATSMLLLFPPTRSPRCLLLLLLPRRHPSLLFVVPSSL